MRTRENEAFGGMLRHFRLCPALGTSSRPDVLIKGLSKVMPSLLTMIGLEVGML